MSVLETSIKDVPSNSSRITRYTSRVPSMLLSEDKASHLAHVILEALKKSPGARVTGEEGKVLREIKRVLAEELAQEGEIDRIVRARLASYSRPLFEGSAEWETLYRKGCEEESRKRRKAGP